MPGKNGIEIRVDSVAAVENEKTQQQQQEADDIRKRREKAERDAETARREAAEKKAAEEAERRRREEERKAAEAEAKRKKEEERQALAAAGTAVLGAAVQGARKAKSGFWKGLIAGILIGAIGAVLLAPSLLAAPAAPVHTSEEAVLEETAPGYTALDFQNAVLGTASEHQELIVMEQPLELSSTITKAGLGNLAVFRKTKTFTCFGTGVYTVDLKHIDAAHILVDEAQKEVTIRIPHAVLQYVNPDYDRMEFEDTDKGILSFGDLTLTLEQQNEVQKAVQQTMTEYLSRDSVLAQADEFARMKTWDTFQPIVSAVSPEFTVNMEIE